MQLTEFSCSYRTAQTVKYWQWFWTSSVVREIAIKLGFAILPEVVRKVVLDALLADVRCNGALVYVPPVTPTVYGVGSAMLSSVLTSFVPAYGAATTEARFTYSSDLANGAASLPTAIANVLSAKLNLNGALATTQAFAVVPASRVSAADAVTNVVLPFAGVAILAVFSPCGSTLNGCQYSNAVLTLSPTLLADILDGTVNTWSDAKLLPLNPWLAGSNIATQGTSIQLVGEASTSETMTLLLELLQPFKPGLSFDATFGVGGTAIVEANKEQVSRRLSCQSSSYLRAKA